MKAKTQSVMKTFVMEDVLWDWGSGMAVVVARDKDHAYEVARKEFGKNVADQLDGEWEELPAESGVYMWGSS